ncbi:hypothetical protein C6341_g27166 [Phytophthora cactorum]|uniref:Uncharacterized protein n=1 Tax=Phytophthora cactorum TaxID=29920 RepID=A0A8T1AT17_9STRA|nr:hypothetical protein PC117_g25385 [Phytophthora cactorum]KAG2980664.1 hypothetical protein PC120_g24925 [Phytophthora cactorum]KAG3121959.1 hypothetical protein C6341_g27166 [Phytophthora cactorum]
MNVVTLRVSAVIAALVKTLRLHSVLGFVRPHHFRNVLHQDVPRFPCISMGRKSSPTNTKTSLISVRLRGFIAHDSFDYPPSRAARIAQWWRQGRKDTPPALEQFQSVEFAQLQHELRYQKAQVAQAAQTASNIQVELGTQVVRLHDRVAALEKLAYAASTSSASHQGLMARVACRASAARRKMSVNGPMQLTCSESRMWCWKSHVNSSY